MSLLQNESGHVGNLTFVNRLVRLEALGQALVIGDLHGDLESLNTILQDSRFLQKMETTKDATLIFLGDYGDRGDKPAEIYYAILKLKLAFPAQVVLLRGNHEGLKELMASPHDLPLQLRYRFGEDWQVVYEKTRAIWNYLYSAVFVEDHYLMVHCGVSPKITKLENIAQAQENHNEALLEDLLWSDPRRRHARRRFFATGRGKNFSRRKSQNKF